MTTITTRFAAEDLILDLYQSAKKGLNVEFNIENEKLLSDSLNNNIKNLVVNYLTNEITRTQFESDLDIFSKMVKTN
jgi:hypothetical protein